MVTTKYSTSPQLLNHGIEFYYKEIKMFTISILDDAFITLYIFVFRLPRNNLDLLALNCQDVWHHFRIASAITE